MPLTGTRDRWSVVDSSQQAATNQRKHHHRLVEAHAGETAPRPGAIGCPTPASSGRRVLVSRGLLTASSCRLFNLAWTSFAAEPWDSVRDQKIGTLAPMPNRNTLSVSMTSVAGVCSTLTTSPGANRMFCLGSRLAAFRLTVITTGSLPSHTLRITITLSATNDDGPPASARAANSRSSRRMGYSTSFGARVPDPPPAPARARVSPPESPFRPASTTRLPGCVAASARLKQIRVGDWST